MKYFYVINIKDKNLSTLIDGIRVLANPNIKQEPNSSDFLMLKNTKSSFWHARILRILSVLKNNKLIFFSHHKLILFLVLYIF